MAEKTIAKVILGIVVLAVCVQMRHEPALLLVVLIVWGGLTGLLYGLDRALRQAFKGVGRG